MCHVIDGGQYWVNSETAGHVPRPPSSLSRPRSSKPRGLGLSSSASAAASPAACHLSLDVLGEYRVVWVLVPVVKKLLKSFIVNGRHTACNSDDALLVSVYICRMLQLAIR